MNAELIEWCRQYGLSDHTTIWLVEHEEQLMDASQQEIDALICELEKEN